MRWSGVMAVTSRRTRLMFNTVVTNKLNATTALWLLVLVWVLKHVWDSLSWFDIMSLHSEDNASSTMHSSMKQPWPWIRYEDINLFLAFSWKKLRNWSNGNSILEYWWYRNPFVGKQTYWSTAKPHLESKPMWKACWIGDSGEHKVDVELQKVVRWFGDAGESQFRCLNQGLPKIGYKGYILSL